MKRLLTTVIIVLALASAAWARNTYLSSFNGQYGTSGTKLDSCSTCHEASFNRNAYGSDFEKALGVSGATQSTALVAIEAMDSDGDGASNAAEIAAGTFPGDPGDTPVVSVRADSWTNIKSLYR